ncbi:hypothetical protein LTR66_010423, partial [Elasticomyces elasticus]
MATANVTDNIRQLLEQERVSIYSQYPHATEPQREKVWEARRSQIVSAINGIGGRAPYSPQSAQVPRSMQSGGMPISRSTSEVQAYPVADLTAGAHACKARLTVPMIRDNSLASSSSSSVSNGFPFDYAFGSSPDPRRIGQRPIPMPRLVEAEVFDDPSDYLSQYAAMSSSRHQRACDAGRLSIPPTLPSSSWWSQSERTLSPSTNSPSEAMTPCSTTDGWMTRQCSDSSFLANAVGAMRMQTISSSIPEPQFDLELEGDTYTFNGNNLPSAYGQLNAPYPALNDQQQDCSQFQLSSYTGGASNAAPAIDFLSPCLSAVAQTQNVRLSPSHSKDQLQYQDMQRTLSEESNPSAISSDHSARSSQRRLQHLANSTRRLASKPTLTPSTTTTTTTPTHLSTPPTKAPKRQISPARVTALQKKPYTRPQHARLYCTQCTENPSGFKGQHELNRHRDRAHAAAP